MDSLNELVSKIAGLIWGVPLLILLAGTGIFLTIRLHGLQIRHLAKAIHLAFFERSPSKDSGTEGDISRFQALMTALSATIGTGNIVGVATAVSLGGPGALFWMGAIAFFGMATKYSEALLAVKYRVKNEHGKISGGPMYYIERGLGLKWLAVLFAAFGALAAFGIGNTVQANAVATNVEQLLNIPPLITGIVLAALIALVLLGGIQSIARSAAVLVPFMASLYFIGCLVILARYATEIPAAAILVVKHAFTPVAAQGGFAGATIWYAMRMGIARGLFSNESGLGSAPIAAAAARTNKPAEQGLVSMLGTFIDTIIICTMTGLVLIVTGAWDDGSEVAGNLTQHAFTTGMPLINGGYIVTIGIILFAFTSTLGWSYYGAKCVEYLFGLKFSYFYRVLWVGAVVLGATTHLDLIWGFADIFNGLMALPNLIGLIGLSAVVVSETKLYLNNKD
ncbi:MAG: sodium:alanine symporter family protein [Verrucomicrobiota bacterium]